MRALRHFAVYRCAGCDRALPVSGVLCPDCSERFRREITAPCPICGVPEIECGCFADGKKSPFERVMHLAGYRPFGVAGRMVLLCKDNRDTPLLDFLSALAANEIERRLRPSGDSVIVPLPRSDKARRRAGFDQSAELARRIAGRLGIDYADALEHKGGRIQKKLGYRERMRNAGDAYSVRDEVTLSGRRVILWDDVVTTGASAAVCGKLLHKAGVTHIDLCTLTRTVRKG